MNDPWHWKVEDVISNLCHSNALWEDRPSSVRPDSLFLEQAIRQQDIDGASLLEADILTLKEVLGLRTLGQYHALTWAVRKLKATSIQYQSVQAHSRSLSPFASRVPPLSFAQTELSPTFFTTAPHTTQNMLGIDAGTPPANGPTSNVTITARPNAKMDLPALLLEGNSASTGMEEPKIRPEEHVVLHKGNKRRRLELTDENTIEAIVPPAANVSVTLPSSTQPSTFKSRLGIEPSYPAYLPHKKIPIDEIFYENLNYGDLIHDVSDQNDNFELPDNSNILLPGLRKYVNRRVMYRLSHAANVTKSSSAVAYPYPERMVIGANDRSATLFKQTDKNTLAMKIRAKYGVEEYVESTEGTDDNSWDFLLSRYPPMETDRVLPVYNDSGSENDFDEDLLAEIEEEASLRQARTSKTSALSVDEVHQIIEERIEHFRTLWQTEKASWRQRKELPVWKSCRGRNAPEIEEQARFDLKKLNGRLEKLIENIERDFWTSTERLQNQCRSLEETVYSQEEIKWKLQVWQRTDEPPRILKTPIKRPARKAITSNDDESESVGSESDGVSDFIDIDDIDMPLSIHGGKQFVHQDKEPGSPLNPEPGLTKLGHMSERQEVLDCVGAENSDNNAREEKEAETIHMIDKGDCHDTESQDLPANVNPTTTTYRTNEAEDPNLGDSSNNTEGKDNIEQTTDSDPSAWDWDASDHQSDRHKIVVKYLSLMDPLLRDQVNYQFIHTSMSRLKENVQKALGSIKNDRVGIPGIRSDHVIPMFAISRLWLCWVDCKSKYYSSTVPLALIKLALSAKEFSAFHSFVQSKIEVVNPSDAETQESTSGTPHKKRKNKVIVSQQAQSLRTDAHRTQNEGEERARKLELELDFSSQQSQGENVVVNIMKYEHEEIIYLNPHIARRIKPHQIDGLRFLWREIVRVPQDWASEAGKNNHAQGSGCLLSHTMGLGKTMQTISLLVTIAEAGAASKISEQIPVNFQNLKTLILCPVGLIENWKDEFRSWLPPNFKKLGDIYDISAADTKKKRYQTIKSWNEDGGVLILGYEMFRSLIKDSARPDQTEDSEAGVVSEYLLAGPRIVIADEAHKLKNKSSAISQAASRFVTKSRIALTGSPLANNLEDYYNMIEWIAPGFLGSISEFKAFYQEPIETGFSEDATAMLFRMAMKKLQALKTEIEPKVNRADISVIAHEIPSKIEFVIMLPLTEWQYKAYEDFINCISAADFFVKGSEGIVQAKLFDFIDFLALLCCHPSIFLKALQNRANSKSIGHSSPDENTGRTKTPEEDLQESLEIRNNLYDRQFKLCPSHTSQHDIMFSYKTIVIEKILLESKRLGDQVLIFAQHLRTLDYLEAFFKRRNDMTYLRFDGSTKFDERVRMVKDFKAGQKDAFLISTRAGSLGLNIAEANRVILVDFSFNPMHEEQAVGRAYRIGQKKNVYVYHLVTGGTYEKDLHDVVVFKKLMAARVVDKKNPARSASRTNQYLVPPKPVAQEDLTSFYGKDVIMDSMLNDPDFKHCIRALKTAETMHRESDDKLTAEEEREAEALRMSNWSKRNLLHQPSKPTPCKPEIISSDADSSSTKL